MAGVGFMFVIVAAIVAVALATWFGRALTERDGSSRASRVTRWLGPATIIVITGITVYAALSAALSDRVTLSVPIEEMPVRPPSDVTFLLPPTATIVSGGFDRVTVVAENLGITARTFFSLSALLSGATIIGVVLVITRLARSLRDGSPFRRGGHALRTTAFIVLIGGTLASITGELAGLSASNDLFEVRGWEATTAVVEGSDTFPEDPDDILTQAGWPSPAPFELTIPFWPLGASIALLLLAAAFEYGAHLQRETEGLV